MSHSAPLKFVHANGLRFAYFEEGSGPLILLLHGFPDTAHTWDFVRPALAKAGFRAVSPFMRGYSPTEIPGDEAFDADTLGKDVLAIIEALGESQALLVGHDWGAHAAFSATGLMPERVRVLVTLDAPHPLSLTYMPFFLWPFVWWGHRHYRSLSRRDAATRIRSGNMLHLDELVQRWSPRWVVPASETAPAKQCLAAPGSLEAALGYYRAAKSVGPTSAQRSKVSVPSVAFCGSDSTPLAAFEQARRCYQGSYEVVRVAGGHFMHRESPEEFTRELIRLLGDHVA
jgi:pimeloyl-ACP methyl ester carboxylesterase